MRHCSKWFIYLHKCCFYFSIVQWWWKFTRNIQKSIIWRGNTDTIMLIVKPLFSVLQYVTIYVTDIIKNILTTYIDYFCKNQGPSYATIVHYNQLQVLKEKNLYWTISKSTTILILMYTSNVYFLLC